MIVEPFKALPPCRCGHSAYFHTVAEKTRIRRDCSVRYGGKCKCAKYDPKEAG